MDEAFKKELIEHCKRQMQRFERMGRIANDRCRI